jgi:hypothetical protein
MGPYPEPGECTPHPPPPPANFPKIHSNPIFPSTPRSPYFRLSHQNLLHFSPTSHVCNTNHPPHSPWFDLPNDTIEFLCNRKSVKHSKLKGTSSINVKHHYVKKEWGPVCTKPRSIQMLAMTHQAVRTKCTRNTTCSKESLFCNWLQLCKVSPSWEANSCKTVDLTWKLKVHHYVCYVAYVKTICLVHICRKNYQYWKCEMKSGIYTFLFLQWIYILELQTCMPCILFLTLIDALGMLDSAMITYGNCSLSGWSWEVTKQESLYATDTKFVS